MPDNSQRKSTGVNSPATGTPATLESSGVRNSAGSPEDVTRESQPAHSPEVKEVAGVAENHDSNRFEVEIESATEEQRTWRNRRLVIIGSVAAVALFAILALVLWGRGGGANTKDEKTVTVETSKESEKEEGAGSEVKLSPEALKAAGVEIEGVTQRPAVALLKVTGTVETNQQQTQQVTPLVAGRVERVHVALGDHVRAGSVLAVIASPEIAEMHGKLREAMARLSGAERNLQRVQRSENRASVLSAKARLDEAEATLKRTRRLIELGVGAGKDLVTAETAYKTAKAEYDFQSNISLNREVQEAQTEVNTARAEEAHLRQSLTALGAVVNETAKDIHRENISLIPVRAPVTGTVTERLVNPGAGIEAGKPLFTIANLGTVWVIANVPEAQVSALRPGTPAEIRSAALGANAIAGRVNYIDPQLSEETRTARVRVEVANPNERLKVGMFVEVGFEAGTGTGAGEELVVPSEAVQRVGDQTVVFIPKDNEPGAFEVRNVELGGEVEGYHRVLGGLKLGDRVVTKGSFALKTQLSKGALGEE